MIAIQPNNLWVLDRSIFAKVVEHQTLNREVLGLIPTWSAMLCP